MEAHNRGVEYCKPSVVAGSGSGCASKSKEGSNLYDPQYLSKLKQYDPQYLSKLKQSTTKLKNKNLSYLAKDILGLLAQIAEGGRSHCCSGDVRGPETDISSILVNVTSTININSFADPGWRGGGDLALF
jgi:hypothetical protein